MSIDAEIDRLTKRAELLKKLKEEFPDLREDRTGWRTLLVSHEVNVNPEVAYTKPACGCCRGVAIFARFYVERHGERVYSDPPEILIGHENEYYEGPDNIWNQDWAADVGRHIGQRGVDLLRPIYVASLEEDTDIIKAPTPPAPKRESDGYSS